MIHHTHPDCKRIKIASECTIYNSSYLITSLQKGATFMPRLKEVMQFTSLNCSHHVLKETWECKVTLHLVVVFAFDIPPTAKVIWRWSHSLKSI